MQPLSHIFSYSVRAKFLSCFVLIAAADWLFYNEKFGWTAGLFALLLVGAMSMHNRLCRKGVARNAMLLSAGLALALVESADALPIVLCSITLLAGALLAMPARWDWPALAERGVRYFVRGWFRLYRDELAILHINRKRRPARANRYAALMTWLLPLCCSLVFIALFASANPLVNGWMQHIDLRKIWRHLNLLHVLFWLACACFCWMLVRPRMALPHAKQRKKFTLLELLFNERAILTSLVLFNALFLMQNVMDVMFLWSGAALPEGMTYAQYAQQGAYPLIATALLAALFVIITLRPGGGMEHQESMRALLYVWVGQNIFLVFSSISRLAAYIDQYSLTYWRIAALVWMGLVALGLALIILRIARGKSNRWLIGANLKAAYVTLYICCFINFGTFIAHYNAGQSSLFARSNPVDAIDQIYLADNVGVASIPILEDIVAKEGPDTKYSSKYTLHYLKTSLKESQDDWRTWSFRNYRLLRQVGEVQP